MVINATVAPSGWWVKWQCLMGNNEHGDSTFTELVWASSNFNHVVSALQSLSAVILHRLTCTHSLFISYTLGRQLVLHSLSPKLMLLKFEFSMALSGKLWLYYDWLPYIYLLHGRRKWYHENELCCVVSYCFFLLISDSTNNIAMKCFQL